MQRENIPSADVHQKERPKTPKSRASSSQSHVSKKSKQNVDTYSMQDSNTRQMPSTPHSRKKSSSGSLKRVDSAKTESRPKQKSSSKKSDKALKRSESFTTAAREGPEPTSRESRRIRSQQGNIPEYSYNDRLDDSEIERMVLPPPPPLNIQGRGLEFNTLSSTLAIQESDHHQLQMPPPSFTTDNIISFHEQPQSQLQAQQTEESTSSPLAVIRRKRANQANWERSRKHESVPKAAEKEPLSIAETIRRKTVFQGSR